MNPFQVLGLRPEIMKGLSDEQVFHLARFMHRELQRVFHPDTQGSGDANRSKQINQAMESVDLDTSPASFARFREEYLKQAKPRQSQIVSSLSSEVEVLTHTNEMLKASFLNYLEGVVYQDKLTVFNAQDVELDMSNTEWIINPAGQDSMRTIRQKTSEPTPSLFRLVIGKKGNMMAHFDSSQKRQKGTKIEGKLIGAISSEELRSKDLGIRDLFTQAGLVSTPDWAPISNTFRARSGVPPFFWTVN